MNIFKYVEVHEVYMVQIEVTLYFLATIFQPIGSGFTP